MCKCKWNEFGFCFIFSNTHFSLKFCWLDNFNILSLGIGARRNSSVLSSSNEVSFELLIFWKGFQVTGLLNDSHVRSSDVINLCFSEFLLNKNKFAWQFFLYYVLNLWILQSILEYHFWLQIRAENWTIMLL